MNLPFTMATSDFIAFISSISNDLTNRPFNELTNPAATSGFGFAYFYFGQIRRRRTQPADLYKHITFCKVNNSGFNGENGEDVVAVPFSGNAKAQPRLKLFYC